MALQQHGCVLACKSCGGPIVFQKKCKHLLYNLKLDGEAYIRRAN